MLSLFSHVCILLVLFLLTALPDACALTCLDFCGRLYTRVLHIRVQLLKAFCKFVGLSWMATWLGANMAFRGQRQLFHNPNDLQRLEPNPIVYTQGNLPGVSIHFIAQDHANGRLASPSVFELGGDSVIVWKKDDWQYLCLQECVHGASCCGLYYLSWSGHAQYLHRHVYTV